VGEHWAKVRLLKSAEKSEKVLSLREKFKEAVASGGIPFQQTQGPSGLLARWTVRALALRPSG
jgi:hypothetical protein